MSPSRLRDFGRSDMTRSSDTGNGGGDVEAALAVRADLDSERPRAGGDVDNVERFVTGEPRPPLPPTLIDAVDDTSCCDRRLSGEESSNLLELMDDTSRQ